MKMKVDFLKYLVIEVHRNTAKALALIYKRLVKETQVASHFASKEETPQEIARAKRTAGIQMVIYTELEFSIMEP
jgi:hypothetical protein